MAVSRAPSPTVEMVPLSRLTPAAWNPRLIRDERFRSLVRSIEEDPSFMRNRPILAMADGTIYAGNMRYRAAASVGWTEVPAIIEDIDEAHAKARAIRDNNAWGEWQDEELSELLHGIGNEGVSLDDLGFDPDALAKMLGLDGPIHGLTDPDDAPPLGEETNIKRGDVFALGEHRLMCGDATSDLATLMGDAKADCLWTDPPYGVAYVGKTKDALTLEGDGMGADALVADVFAAALGLMQDGAPFYCAAPAGSRGFTFWSAIVTAGWQFHEELVWVKDSMVLGHSDYHFKHEPILYGYAPGKGRSGRGKHDGSHWYGDHSQTTVLEFDRPKRSEEHPTMKPVALVASMLANSTLTNGIVLDPFVGSGTTIIAAEQLGRRCYAMDIDPRYVAVAIKRWEDFSGQQAQQA